MRFQIVYLTAMVIVFGLVAFFTGARARRLAGALAAVICFTALSAPIDRFAASMGWWTYPSCVDPPHPPLTAYLGQALMFVGNVALIGWRVGRRFGARGLVWLTIIVCGLGLVRDLSVGALVPEAIQFGAMPMAALADLGAWAVVVLVALGVGRLVGGRFRES
jgi:hypothetical protein